MAILLLWEVDHDQPWPSPAASRSYRLTSFTRRLIQQVSQDTELNAWFTPKVMLRSLVPGVLDARHNCWPVQVTRPKPQEPQGWYEEFVTRWKAYLSSLASPRGAAAISSIQHSPSSAELEAAQEASSESSSEPERELRRPRPETTTHPAEKKRRVAPPSRPRKRRTSGPIPPGDTPTQRPAKRLRRTQSPAKQQQAVAKPPASPAPAGGKSKRHGRAQKGPPT